MELIELVRRGVDDPFYCTMHESHKLVSIPIDIDSTLCKRFEDVRTPYEQYCAGEKYLKYDNKRLYSRAAHEYMSDIRRLTIYPKKNFKLDFNI